jgi:5'-nucleotidase
MPYAIENKLVVAVASSALFDLTESDQVFRDKGEDAYREFQREKKDVCLDKGVAFPFVRRFLKINEAYPEKLPVEVVLLSRNDPETGLRVFSSISKYGLDITRAAFLSGRSPYEYIPAFNVSLFLSANQDDVRKAVEAGYPAGIVVPGAGQDEEHDPELRVAFDFDGVIADDEAEQIYQKSGAIEVFQGYETDKANIPHTPGPLANLFRKLSFFQKLERKRAAEDRSYKRILRTAIVTARSAPAHERVVTTLRAWGVAPDDTFFLGGIEKLRVLNVLRPHIFFDDQLTHLASAAGCVPSVHIPFGTRNVRPGHSLIRTQPDMRLEGASVVAEPSIAENTVVDCARVSRN